MTEQRGGSLKLENKVAFITGAGQGIGRGIAHAMVKEGAAVAVVGRGVEKIERVADEIRSFGGNALAVKCDVTSRQETESAVATAVDVFGGIDILVNNAQDLRDIYKPLIEITDADMERSIESGIMGSLYCMQTCFPYLKVNGGKIINFGSAGGITGVAKYPAYAISKEGIRALTRVAAREWGTFGINVNTICPAADTPTGTEMQEKNPEMKAMVDELVAALPIPRRGLAEEDIGRVAVFLASSDAGYITGHTFMVDGGGYMDAGR
jgi:NAD(P)-dependent dehydrogenase (short-subunit alcohol dehydrogenase family)